MMKYEFRMTRRKRRRGIAEIEALFSIFILIAVLLLTWGMARLGLARLNAVEDAMCKVMANSQTGQTPEYTGDSRLTEVTAVWDIRPGLPNRTHVATSEKEFSVNVGNVEALGPFKPGAIAGTMGPSWMLSSYPATGEIGTTRAWFEEFITESHIELAPPLMLQPSWLP
jgi:hypothetical protein